MKITKKHPKYGIDDASFIAAGGEEGVFRLVNSFYDVMMVLPEAKSILDMHPTDLSVSRDKLACFLCAWLGGPRLYSQKYGAISIPGVHSHLSISEKERDLWLLCMQKALALQPYEDDFKEYLLEQLFIPAERIRMVSQKTS